MTDQPSAEQVIRAAIAAAGGFAAVAEHFGIASQSVTGWAQRGSVPAVRIKPLCELGRNVVSPDQILEAMTREAGARAAA